MKHNLLNRIGSCHLQVFTVGIKRLRSAVLPSTSRLSTLTASLIHPTHLLSKSSWSTTEEHNPIIFYIPLMPDFTLERKSLLSYSPKCFCFQLILKAERSFMPLGSDLVSRKQQVELKRSNSDLLNQTSSVIFFSLQYMIFLVTACETHWKDKSFQPPTKCIMW